MQVGLGISEGHTSIDLYKNLRPGSPPSAPQAAEILLSRRGLRWKERDVIPTFRADFRPNAMAVACPRNRLTCNVIHIFLHSHAENATISAKTPKTYGRFFGMFFLRWFYLRLSLNRNYLQRSKSQKTEKVRKKCQIFSASPRFSAKQELFCWWIICN